MNTTRGKPREGRTVRRYVRRPPKPKTTPAKKQAERKLASKPSPDHPARPEWMRRKLASQTARKNLDEAGVPRLPEEVLEFIGADLTGARDLPPELEAAADQAIAAARAILRARHLEERRRQNPQAEETFSKEMIRARGTTS